MHCPAVRRGRSTRDSQVSRSEARTYEVPISYYGRSYEEGKKIGIWYAVMAGLYTLYYNLVAPTLPAGRHYVAQANASLSNPGGHSQRSVNASSLHSW